MNIINPLTLKNLTQILYRYIFVIIMSLVVFGCAKHIPKTQQPIDFRFVTVKQGDTLPALAKTYIGDSKLAWRIKQFNGINTISPGKEIIIPLTPYRPGGMTAQGFQLIPVLSYHNFSRGPSSNKLTVSAKDFRDQLSYLKQNNYHVITMDQLIDFLNFGQVPEKSVLITIDDGWISSYEIAYPLLKQYGFNATLFVPTQFINSGSGRAISWNQIQEMVSDNTIDIQCHSKSHRDLSAINYNESFTDYVNAINRELTQSKKIIFDKVGKKVKALAYPFGNTNSLAMALLDLHEYKAAFTVNRKGNPFFIQSLKLNRSMIYGTYSIKRFADNLQYFEPYTIAEPEPIDRLSILSHLTNQDPQTYEKNGQYRSALLAWKLRRDKFLSKQANFVKEISEQELQIIRESIAEAKKKVWNLSVKLNDASKKYYVSALKTMRQESAQKELLQALLFNPDNKAPIDIFQTDMGKNRPLFYQVKENDTFESIATTIYQDPNKAILIPLFNSELTSESDLKTATKLTIPSIPVEFKVKPNISQKNCHISITKSPKLMAVDFYTKAIEQFNNDNISAAIESLESAICLDPNHTQAQEMLEMLNDI